MALCALSVYQVGPSTAVSLSTAAPTLMHLYQIICEDNGNVVVQIFFLKSLLSVLKFV